MKAVVPPELALCSAAAVLFGGLRRKYTIMKDGLGEAGGEKRIANSF